MSVTTSYAKSGDIHIAYQVTGEGTLDLVPVFGWLSHVEHQWESPEIARFRRRCDSFARQIYFDPRGMGLSDRAVELATLEQQMDDVIAVMDKAGSDRAVIWGFNLGAPLAALFAATYPERTSALVLYAPFPRVAAAPDYPWGWTPEVIEMFLQLIGDAWGTGMFLSQVGSNAGPHVQDWAAKLERIAGSPGSATRLLRMYSDIDVRHVFRAISVPSLVLHRRDDPFLSVEVGRYVAGEIPNAKFVELEGSDHIAWLGDTDALIDEVEEWLTGVRRGPEPDRVLATVMFTDIVGSTEKAAALGDEGWRNVLESHHAIVRKELSRARGIEVDTAGDGFFARFDGPARAIRCAEAMIAALRAIDIDIRVGLHTGEVELIGDRVQGIAVHIGARVGSKAGAGEILVSSTVRDLVAGSGLSFEALGQFELKGVPGEWNLFRVAS